MAVPALHDRRDYHRGVILGLTFAETLLLLSLLLLVEARLAELELERDGAALQSAPGDHSHSLDHELARRMIADGVCPSCWEWEDEGRPIPASDIELQLHGKIVAADPAPARFRSSEPWTSSGRFARTVPVDVASFVAATRAERLVATPGSALPLVDPGPSRAAGERARERVSAGRGTARLLRQRSPALLPIRRMTRTGGRLDASGPPTTSRTLPRRRARVALAARLGVRLAPTRAPILLDERGLRAPALVQRPARLPRWFRFPLLAWSACGRRR